MIILLAVPLEKFLSLSFYFLDINLGYHGVLLLRIIFGFQSINGWDHAHGRRQGRLFIRLGATQLVAYILGIWISRLCTGAVSIQIQIISFFVLTLIKATLWDDFSIEGSDPLRRKGTAFINAWMGINLELLQSNLVAIPKHTHSHAGRGGPRVVARDFPRRLKRRSLKLKR